MIDNKITEEFEKYLTLFGLSDDYSMEELTASFRILAKLNHPDIVKDTASEEKMVLINEGYDFLKDVLSNDKYDFLKKEQREKKKEDIFYSQYKKGFLILKTAFEDYFGESEDKSRARDEDILKENLLLAKKEFSKLVNDLPYNEWVNDAIDKISSINKWLY